MMSDKRKASMSSEEKAQWREAETMRVLAFFGISVAVTACMVGIIAVPMLYGYLQRVQSVLQVESDYCKSATGTLLRQFTKTQIEKGVPFVEFNPFPESLDEAIKARMKRQAGYDAPVSSAPHRGAAHAPAHTPTGAAANAGAGQEAPSAGVVSSQPIHVADKGGAGTCCSCGIGPAGPPGEPGSDGQPGNDGHPGSNGENGVDAAPGEQPKAEDWCFECEPSQAGPPGKPGPKGPPGNPGPNGESGAPGTGSSPGEPGPPGPSGERGSDGAKGEPGPAGVVQEVDLGPGPAGPAGPEGPAGPTGENGSDGKPGISGPPGPPGDAGTPGSAGKPGEEGDQGPAGEKGGEGQCDHCPPPRTAPGY